MKKIPSARKSRMERIKNEHIKEIMGVKKKPDIVDIIERKRLQWYGHVKRMQDERLPNLIMEWIPGERRKRGRPRKTWMEGVRAAMKTRHLEADQWLTHCGRVTQICVFNAVKLGTSASSP